MLRVAQRGDRALERRRAAGDHCTLGLGAVEPGAEHRRAGEIDAAEIRAREIGVGEVGAREVGGGSDDELLVARFDHAYYRDTHMPLVKARMGDACLFYTVDRGLAGGGPGEPATYVGMCHIYCDSVASFQAGFGPHAKEIMADIPNYTDLTPVMQVSEVVVG